jgi:kynurenine formamidase
MAYRLRACRCNRLALLVVLLVARTGLALDAETARLVDLTHPFDDSTVYWPTARRFHLEPVAHGKSPGGWWYAANDFCAAEHGGTHLDAPIHFAEGGWTADEIPLDRLRGPAVVIDVTSRAAADRDLLIRVDDLRAHEAIHGRIPDGAVVLLRTGWSSRWPDLESYLGTAVPGDVAHLHFPGLSEEAARWLVTERACTASASTPRRSIAARRRTSAPIACSPERASRSSRTSTRSSAPPRGACSWDCR